MPDIGSYTFEDMIQAFSANANDGYGGEIREPKRYEHLTGPALYERQYISGVNRIPVAEMLDWVVDGAEVEWPEAKADVNLGEPIRWTVDDVVTQHLVSGGSVTQDSADEGLVFLSNIMRVKSPRLWLQRMDRCKPEHFYHLSESDHESNPFHRAVLREGKSDGGSWEIHDYYGYGTDKQQEVPLADYSRLKISPPENGIPYDDIKAFPWGRGILEPNNYLIQRIERLAIRLDQYTDPTANATYTFGANAYTEQLNQAKADKAGRIDMNSAARVEHPANASIPAILLEEYARDMELLYAATGLVRMTEVANRSGIALQLMLKRTLAAVRRIRADITLFVEAFGGTVQFPVLTTMSVDEIAATYDVYKALKADGIMGEEEYIGKSRELVALPEERPDDLEVEEEPEPVIPPGPMPPVPPREQPVAV